MKGVAVLASFSRQGEWAFEFALTLAKKHQTRLDIYSILASPHALRREEVYVDDKKQRTAIVTPEIIAQKERELREAFAEELGDFTDVAYHVSEGDEEWELNKHFKRGAYDLLVVGYEGKGGNVGASQTIEDFASRYRGPLVLVGPGSRDSYFLNKKAKERLPDLGIPEGKCHELGT